MNLMGRALAEVFESHRGTTIDITAKLNGMATTGIRRDLPSCQHRGWRILRQSVKIPLGDGRILVPNFE